MCCTYCGGRAQTRDHVPPKSIFLKPLPGMITVPACRRCNQEWSRAEQYFLDTLTSVVENGIEATRERALDLCQLSRVGLKILYGVCLHTFGPAFQLQYLTPATLVFDEATLSTLPTSKSPWRTLQAEAVQYAINYRSDGFDCVVSVHNAIWILGRSSWLG